MLMQTLHLANHSFVWGCRGMAGEHLPEQALIWLDWPARLNGPRALGLGNRTRQLMQVDAGRKKPGRCCQMHAPHPDVARFIHHKTNLALCRENSPRASSPRWDRSHRSQLPTSYHNTTTQLILRYDAGIRGVFALGEGSYHPCSLSSSGNGCLPEKLTMLSNKHASLLYYYYYHSYCFSF